MDIRAMIKTPAWIFKIRKVLVEFNNLSFARQLRAVHLSLTLGWAALAVPTLLWWRTSILWVALMSLYANFVGHFSAWQASRAEVVNEEDP